MKFLLCVFTCIMMAGCAGTMSPRQTYMKAANDMMMEFVPQMVNSIPMAFPGADHLQGKEIVLTEDNNIGFIVLTAEDQKGKIYETIYLLIMCGKSAEKTVCVPASILTSFSIKGVLNKARAHSNKGEGKVE